jgi:hypothetical protein
VGVLVSGEELYLELCDVTGYLVPTIAECTSYGNVKFNVNRGPLLKDSTWGH